MVALVGAGLSHGEIAQRLYVVEGTVKAHVSAVLGRLGLRTRYSRRFWRTRRTWWWTTPIEPIVNQGLTIMRSST